MAEEAAKPTLNIFLGGKGGTGKTLLALCHVLRGIFHLKKVLIVDLNFNNGDLAELIRPLAVHGPGELPLGDTGFTLLPVKYQQGDSIQTLSYLAAPQPGGKVFGRLPPGISGIYQQLDSVLKAVEQGEEEGWEGFIPDVCIVDTPFHLSNLLPTENNAPSLSSYTSIINYEVKLWFIWTLAIAHRPDEIEAAEEALHWLSRDGILILPDNLIHVLNPYVLTSPFFRLFPRTETTIRSLEEFLDGTTPVGEPISFRRFSNLIDQGAKKNIGDELQEFLFNIVKEIKNRNINNHARLSAFMQKKGDRPRNVFPIPYFRHVLIGYTEALEYEAQYSLEDLLERLGNVYQALERYLYL